MLPTNQQPAGGGPTSGRVFRRSPNGIVQMACLALIAMIVTVTAIPSVAVEPTESFDGELLVRWADGTSSEGRQTTYRAHRLRHGRELTEHIDLVTFKGAAPAHQKAAQVAESPHIRYAEPNHEIVSFQGSGFVAASRDPLFGEQWGMQNVGQEIDGQAGTVDVDTDGPHAWLASKGSGAPIVAVVDGGIDVEHQDLAGNVWLNKEEATGRGGVDDDGNGYVDDLHGWDFVRDDASVFDEPTGFTGDDAHGTHVTGIIAAAENGRGVVGGAPDVQFMALKFLEGGSGRVDDAIEAIQYATNNGAGILNASWGTTSYSQSLRDVLRDSNLAVFAAAGNSGANTDENPEFPAAYDLPNILSVTAVDNRGELPAFANYGATSVDVGGPGVDVLSSVPGNEYAFLDGTSMAAPHATAIAALVASGRSNIAPSDLVAAVREAVTPLPALEGVTATGGLLNASRAARSNRDSHGMQSATPRELRNF